MAVHFSKIGIVGAGISGMAAAKQLSEHNPVVFEASDSLGGVWKHCCYRSTQLQTPHSKYEFSDFAWTQRESSSFPSYQEVLDYIYSYATHFDLLKFVKFNSKVVEIRFLGNPETAKVDGKQGDGTGSLLNSGQPVWQVAVQSNQSEKLQWFSFKFLVICTGKYGDEPNLPAYPHKKGPEAFKGKVMHVLDYCKLDQEASVQLLKGKKVVIIGYKKSAIDLAVECAEANQGSEGKPCTVVVRTSHWNVPQYFTIWGLPFYLFFSTRLSQFFYERPNQGSLKTIFCHLTFPMRRAISKIIESYLVWKLPLQKYDLKPNHPFVEDYASCQMVVLPENFFAEADKGKIMFKRASQWWFWEDGIEFEDNTRLEADVVFLATGYDGKKKLKAILPEPFRTWMEFPSGMLSLYRGTIHPFIPNMAFVGYVESATNLHATEICCIWLAQLLRNQCKLPEVEKMVEQTTNEMEIMKRTTRFYQRNCISTFSINRSDEICEEIGWRSLRKKNWFAEAFSPYSSRDYEEEKKYI